MLIVTAPCPDCMKQVGVLVYKAGTPYRPQRASFGYLIPVIGKCPGSVDRPCGRHIFLELECFQKPESLIEKIEDPSLTLFKEDLSPEGLSFKVGNVYPDLGLYYPDVLPEKIRELFFTAQWNALSPAGHPAVAIATCGSVLELALQKLEAEGNSLYERIQDVHRKGLIPQALVDWAHIIRRYRNLAVHEVEGDKDEAREIVELTKFFLIYTLELPARLRAERR